MIRLFKKITSIGLHEALSYSERKRIRLLNEVTLITMIGIFLKVVNEVMLNDPIGYGISFSTFCLVGMTLFFQYLRRYKVARWYITLMGILVSLSLILLFGRNFGGEFILFAIFLLLNIFYESTADKIGLYSTVILGYTCIQAYFIFGYEPMLKDNLSESTYYFMFIFSAITILIMSIMLLRENEKFNKNAIRLLDSLKEKNTELSRNQLEMVAQNKKLEAANIELEKFAFVASHDLKTPLRNVNSFLNLLDRKLPADSKPELREYIEIASSNAKHMYNLIQDILEYSRINKGGLVEFEETNLYNLMKRVIFNLQDTINSKGVKIQIHKLPNIVCNESQMVMLFQNLISNGITYNEDAEPTIQISSKIIGDDVLIRVKDNGIGIDPQYFDKVFEMFSRLHTQGEYAGSGIGLAICKKIVLHNGGDITLESHKNKGTTFIIRLPKENPLALEKEKEIVGVA